MRKVKDEAEESIESPSISQIFSNYLTLYYAIESENDQKQASLLAKRFIKEINSKDIPSPSSHDVDTTYAQQFADYSSLVKTLGKKKMPKHADLFGVTMLRKMFSVCSCNNF